MATSPLPTKLKKQPIVDAIFEIRFLSSAPASTIIPGILFSKLKDLRIERLAAADIPSQIRALNPALGAQPLARLQWGGFNVLVGDVALGLASPLPYPGWNDFRSRIIELFGVLDEFKFIDKIERYSLKSVSLIEGKGLAEHIGRVQIDFRMGDFQLKNEPFSFRVERQKEPVTLVVQLGAPASVSLIDGSERNGLLIDIDGISEYDGTVGDFMFQLPKRIDDLHGETKRIFFDLLTPETLSDLEPVYETA